MAVLTVYSAASGDLYTLRGTNATYATANALAEGVKTPDTYIIVGQEILTGPLFAIFRSFVYFDTSSIPSTAIIYSATLSFDCFADGSLVDFDVVVRNGQDTYPTNPIATTDFDATFYSGDGGSVNTYGLVTDIYTDITLNATGRSWIKKGSGAVTKLALISSRDINVTQNSGSEYLGIGSGPNGRPRPKLVVIYNPNAALTVFTNNVSDNFDGLWITANGKVTDTGGHTVTRRGFQYGLTKTATWTVQDTGSFPDAETYSKVITGLTDGTKYYIRAVAENINADIAYGSWVEFVAGEPYGIYEESNSQPDSDGIYANSNTICFYVRRAGGKWSIKHGPYTKDQADIEITKILTEGKGKYQIKFTSDVLTGLSVSIMTKMDIKAR